jgi:hypothetical protein
VLNCEFTPDRVDGVATIAASGGLLPVGPGCEWEIAAGKKQAETRALRLEDLATAGVAAAEAAAAAELAEWAARPKLSNGTIREAVAAFTREGGGRAKTDFKHSPEAEARYGPVELWDVSEVTDFRQLFIRCEIQGATDRGFRGLT